MLKRHKCGTLPSIRVCVDFRSLSNGALAIPYLIHHFGISLPHSVPTSHLGSWRRNLPISAHGYEPEGTACPSERWLRATIYGAVSARHGSRSMITSPESPTSRDPTPPAPNIPRGHSSLPCFVLIVPFVTRHKTRFPLPVNACHLSPIISQPLTS